MMDESERIAFLEKSLERMLAWVRSADAKLSFIVAIDTAMLGIASARAPHKGDWTGLALCGMALCILPVLASLAMAYFAAHPRVKGPPGSRIYFGGVSQRTAEQYLAEVGAMDNSDYLQDLAKQVHRNAQIAEVKYRYVAISAWLLLVAILAWSVGLAALLNA